MSPAVKSLFNSKTKGFLDFDITSLGVLPSIAEALHKYELFDYSKIGMIALHSQLVLNGKKQCGIRSSILRGMHEIASANLILT